MSFSTVITVAGQTKFAAAIASNTPLGLAAMAVGDGNGAPTTPDAANTALVNEVFRGALGSLSRDPGNPANVVAELTIPASVGGWTVRECGLYDTAGTLVAIANLPDTAKPTPAGGSARDLSIRMVFTVGNASAVTLEIDPSVVLASRAYVESTYHITTAQTVTVGTGGDFATVQAALDAIAAKRIGPNGSYTIRLLDNGAAQPAVVLDSATTVNLRHPDASRITITGTTVATVPVTGVAPNGANNAVANADGSWRITLNATDTSMVAVGDYITVNATAQRPIPCGAFFSDATNPAKIYMPWRGAGEFATGDKLFLTHGLGPNSFPNDVFTVISNDGPGKNGVTLDRALPVTVANRTDQQGPQNIRAARAYHLKNGATKKAGGVSFTANSSTLTGAGTSFLSDVNPGDMIIASNFPCFVASVQDDTHLTLASPATESVANCGFLVATNPANLNGAMRVMAKTPTSITVRSWVKLATSVLATWQTRPDDTEQGNALGGSTCFPRVGLNSIKVQVFKSALRFTADTGILASAAYRIKDLALVGDDEQRTPRASAAIQNFTDERIPGCVGIERVAIAGFGRGLLIDRPGTAHLYGDIYASNIGDGVYVAHGGQVLTIGAAGIYISGAKWSGFVLTKNAVASLYDCTIGGVFTDDNRDGHGVIAYDGSQFGCNSAGAGRGLSVANVGGSGIRVVNAAVYADCCQVFASACGNGASNNARLSVSWGLLAGMVDNGTLLWANMSQIDATGVLVSSAPNCGIASDQGARVVASLALVAFCPGAFSSSSGSQLDAYLAGAAHGSNPQGRWFNGAFYAVNNSSITANGCEIRGFAGQRVYAEISSHILVRDLLFVTESPAGGSNLLAVGNSLIDAQCSATRTVATNPSGVSMHNSSLLLTGWTLSGAAAPWGGTWDGQVYFN